MADPPVLGALQNVPGTWAGATGWASQPVLISLIMGIVLPTNQAISGALEWAHLAWGYGPHVILHSTLLGLAGVHACSVIW